jgi:hypothetical protein
MSSIFSSIVNKVNEKVLTPITGYEVDKASIKKELENTNQSLEDKFKILENEKSIMLTNFEHEKSIMLSNFEHEKKRFEKTIEDLNYILQVKKTTSDNESKTFSEIHNNFNNNNMESNEIPKSNKLERLSVYLVNNLPFEDNAVSLVNVVLKEIERDIYFGAKDFNVEIDFYIWNLLTKERLDIYQSNTKNNKCVFILFQHSFNYPKSIFSTLFLQTMLDTKAEKLRMDTLSIPKSLVFSFACNGGKPAKSLPTRYLMQNIITLFNEHPSDSFLIFTKPNTFLPVDEAIQMIDLFGSQKGLGDFWDYFNEKEKEEVNRSMMFQRYNWVKEERFLSDYKISTIAATDKTLEQPRTKLTASQKERLLAED